MNELIKRVGRRLIIIGLWLAWPHSVVPWPKGGGRP